MRKIIIYTLLVFSCLKSWGQGQNDITEINVTTKRTIETAFRFTENPKIIDSIKPTQVIEYPLLVIQHPTQIILDTIKPASIKIVDKLPQLYHSYVKLGIGSKLMPLGEIYFDGNRSRRYAYGVHAKHLSSFGDIKGYAPAQYDRNNLNLTAI